jgi:lauroyl/myristoyl acyltransferase
MGTKRGGFARCAAESALVVAALIVVPWMPRGWLVRFARALGLIGFRLSSGLRRIALANLDLAFGASVSDARKGEIARECFRNFALVVLDIFWFSVRCAERVRRCVVFDGSFDLDERSGGTVTVTAHFGNWEVMGLATPLRGCRLVSVAAPLKNAFVDRVLNRNRRLTGQTILPKSGAVRAAVRALRSGGTVALLVDQNILPDEGGAFVDFFGVPVPMAKTAAALAARFGGALKPMFCRVEADGTYVLYARPPVPALGGDLAATQALAGAIEREVRCHPEQWLWMYKRWKHVAPGRRREEYPFYSRRYEPAQDPAREGAT